MTPTIEEALRARIDFLEDERCRLVGALAYIHSYMGRTAPLNASSVEHLREYVGKAMKGRVVG